MDPEQTTYRLLEGHGILVHHFGEPLRLVPGKPCTVPVRVGELRAAA